MTNGNSFLKALGQELNTEENDALITCTCRVGHVLVATEENDALICHVLQEISSARRQKAATAVSWWPPTSMSKDNKRNAIRWGNHALAELSDSS